MSSEDMCVFTVSLAEETSDEFIGVKMAAPTGRPADELPGLAVILAGRAHMHMQQSIE